MLCDRILVFRGGKVAEVLDGPQDSDDIFVAVFAIGTDRRPLRRPANRNHHPDNG